MWRFDGKNSISHLHLCWNFLKRTPAYFLVRSSFYQSLQFHELSPFYLCKIYSACLYICYIIVFFPLFVSKLEPFVCFLHLFQSTLCQILTINFCGVFCHAQERNTDIFCSFLYIVFLNILIHFSSVEILSYFTFTFDYNFKMCFLDIEFASLKIMITTN